MTGVLCICTKRVQLTKAGTIRPHAVPIASRKDPKGGYERCFASGQLPEEVGV